MKRIPTLIITINKIASWVLLICFLIYMISGFDIQLRFLSAPISSLIHLVYLFAVAQAAFAIHTSYVLHLAFKRWRIWNALGKSLLGLYIALNASLFVVYFIIHH